MKKLSRKTKILVLGLGLVAFLGVGVVVGKLLFGNHKRLSEIEAEVRGLKEEKALLEKDLRETQDRDFVEKEARERLNMVYPGETVVVLPKEDQGAGEDMEKDEGFNLWQWLQGLF